jgi:excisionase family DNA binding protein
LTEKDKLMRPDEVALRLLVSPKTVYRLASEAQFRCCKVRGQLRIWAKSVEDYLERRTQDWEKDNGEPENFQDKRDN